MLLRNTNIQQISTKIVFYSHFKLVYQKKVQNPATYLR